jgi:hypothetical protein
MRYSLAAELIARPGNVRLLANVDLRPGDDLDFAWCSVAIRDLDEAKRVRVDDLIENAFDDSMLLPDTPSLEMRLPFDRMWFEFTTSDSRWSHDGSDITIGVHAEHAGAETASLLSQNVGLGYIPDHVITMVIYVQRPNGVFLLGSVEYLLDENYRYINRMAFVPEASAELSADLKELGVDAKPEMSLWLFDMSSPAAKAITMLNCSNVKLEEAQAPNSQKKQKKVSRRALPALSFSTVRLPGVSYERNGRVSGISAGDMRQHMVRGHQKRFTADSPLLGKHVGNYWWKPMSRGSAELGKVVTDYVVAESRVGTE